MKAKRVAIALSLLLVFVMLFSHLFVIAEADHDCSGEDCPVCLALAVIEEILKGLSLLLLLVAFSAALTSLVTKLRHAFVPSILFSTPVLLKVKLTN